MTRPDWHAMRAVVAKDFRAVSRAKAVVIPMIAVPVLLLLLIPSGLMLLAKSGGAAGVTDSLGRLPGPLRDHLLSFPADERLVILIGGYLLAPLFIVVPLMVASVLAVDAFAGEKERRTMEGLLHLPISDRDLFVAKVGGAFLPAVAVSWAGFVCYSVIVNVIAWPTLGRVFVPTAGWALLILWVSPAVAAVGMGVMVWISSRSSSTQEANQLGGAVVLPLIFTSVAQTSVLLLTPLWVAFAAGAVIWVAAVELLRRGARRFSRDRMAAQT